MISIILEIYLLILTSFSALKWEKVPSFNCITSCVNGDEHGWVQGQSFARPIQTLN